MREFHATLNLTFDADDEEEALFIATICRNAVAEYERQPYKVEIEVDKVEEA